MEAFWQQFFAGLANGCIYGPMALALVMIHQATHHVNFAQGEMATFGTFCAWALLQMGWPYWAAFGVTVAGSFVGGVLIQQTVIRPFERAPVLTNIVVSIGLLLVFNAITGWIFDHTVRPFPSPFAGIPAFGSYLSSHQVGTIMVMLLVLFLVFAFFRFTPMGLAMKAAAQNPESARLVGISVAWMLALGWGLASAIGVIAGMLVAPIVFLDPHMMGAIFLYGLASALLGGIDSPVGAIVGGFIVGVLENLVGAFVLGNELKLTFALVLIVATLMIRPFGLFGRPVVTRV